MTDVTIDGVRIQLTGELQPGDWITINGITHTYRKVDCGNGVSCYGFSATGQGPSVFETIEECTCCLGAFYCADEGHSKGCDRAKCDACPAHVPDARAVAAKQDHTDHGRGDEDGPEDADCPCRGTMYQDRCAGEGCGFCVAAAKTHAPVRGGDDGEAMADLLQEQDEYDANRLSNGFTTCIECGCELSKTLDAYHGRDPYERGTCIKCRGKTTKRDPLFDLPF